jgi:hypothetical protein
MKNKKEVLQMKKNLNDNDLLAKMDEIDNDKKLTDEKKHKMLLKLVDKVRTDDEISYLVDLLNTYR